MYQTVRHLLEEGIPAKRLWWLRLDHPLLLRVPLDDLVRQVVALAHATSRNHVFLFLDELTYAKDWDLWLKTFYDDKWPVRIAATSSSTAAMRERKLESGVGRWEEQYLAPYTFTEFLELTGQAVPIRPGPTLESTLTAAMMADVNVPALAPHRRRYLLTGGFPELLLSLPAEPQDEATRLLESQRTLRTDAIERAVYKDIPQAFGIDNPMMLERLLYVLAGQVTGLLSPRSLCQSLDGLGQVTFDRYVSYLERAFIVFTLPNFAGSEETKQRRGRRLYFVDGAVRNAALQRGLAPLNDQAEMGVLLENLAASQLHALAVQAQVRLHHWRRGHDEVDLIFDHPAEPMAFEIASSAGHTRSGLFALRTAHSRLRGRTYLVAPNAVRVPPGKSGDSVGSVPLDLFLLAVGVQAQRELSRRLQS